jgi:hypothetical protein
MHGEAQATNNAEILLDTGKSNRSLPCEIRSPPSESPIQADDLLKSRRVLVPSPALGVMLEWDAQSQKPTTITLQP